MSYSSKTDVLRENKELWDEVRKVDPRYTKEVSTSGKQPFTNIDAYYLIERATKCFGSYGKGFGFKELHIDEVPLGDTVLLKLRATFFYPDGSFPIYNALKIVYQTQKGYQKVDEDAYKKIITNTIGKALSYLGFGADVYMGKFEDSTYVQEVAQEFATEEYYGYIAVIKEYIERAENKEKVTAWILKKGGVDDIGGLSFDKAKEIAKLIKQKQKRATYATT